ncbi:hypothetical protein COU54_02045 [Candidatus Pacearchaeota archaeon CG10_big_fil_rev_8_21_14_0_10_31_24]|nr:MAG: hypothetical protein COU54_02045 [Candidatus Pacearchaeota archaeon CG10_big_fil_rev_8_21_14_0_10_31_24]
MQNKFKRHDFVTLLRSPDPEYVEYHNEAEDQDEHPEEKIPIIKGMKGKVNLILKNGQYHVEILDKKGKTLAYAPFHEEDLESN